MRKRIAAILMLFMLVTSYAEEAPEEQGPALYEYAQGDAYAVDGEGYVDFDGLFTLRLPDGWQRYVITEEQAAGGIFVCFGDGATFMTVKKEADSGEYADAAAYAEYLAGQGGYPGAFVSAFGDAEEFVLYSEPENSSAMCAAVIPGAGIYTFAFSPVAADAEHGQIILDMMASCAPAAPTEGAAE